MIVCLHCLTNPTLQSYVSDHGTSGDCPTCGAADTTTIDASDLRDLFEPLAQLYEPSEAGKHYAWDAEDDAPIFGDVGEPLEHIVQEWDIFSDDIVDEIPKLLEDVWPHYEADSLYVSQDLWYEPPDRAFQRLAKRLMHERRWFPKKASPVDEINIDSILGGHLEDFVEYSDEADSWFRARKHERWIGSPKPTAYDKGQMACPPKERITRSMRANPPGIAYLYLASGQPTVVAEVRAVTGDYLSVGEFALPSNLKLINLARDLRELDPFEYADLRAEIERRSLLRELGGLLSKPVRDEDHEVDYVVSQYLVEYIASEGYDGILFKSAMAAGRNLVLFDSNNAKCRGVTLCFVKRATITYEVTKAS